MLTIPIVWSSSTIGTWRNPCSSMIFAASAGVESLDSVSGSAVIHSLTRASLVCTRPATARVRSRSVTIPIKRP
jgi:hypothetical protein